MKINDVIKESDPKKEFVTKNERKIVRLYDLDGDGETVTPVDTKGIIDYLIEAIKDEIDVEDLLEEVFSNTPPDLIIKMYTKLKEEAEELEIDVGSTPSYHCCYSILLKSDSGEIEVPISGGRYDRKS